MQKKRIVLYGGSLNPPTAAHDAAVRQLKERFDRVVVLPCGIRPDKWETNAVDAAHRANMARIAFADMGVTLDLSDLERDQFLTTLTLDRLWKGELGDGWEVWHAVGSDLIAGGARGASEIQSSWHEGRWVWENLNFAVFPRPEYPITEADLPPRREMLPDLNRPESSRKARAAFARGQPQLAGVPARIAAYVSRYGLYAGAPGPRRQGRLVLPPDPKLLVIPAAGNERARAIMERIGPRDGNAPDAVVAIGGDGHMLDVIGSVRPGIPIIGINAGHRGFLLNEIDGDGFNAHVAVGSPFDTHLLSMLEIEFRLPDGTWDRRKRHAFNDVWLERDGMQTAWFRVAAEGQNRHEIPRLACDTVLVSTPAGSTAYARAMGAPPQLIDTPVLVLAASAVADPAGWHHAMVPDDATITIEALDPVKRPVRAAVDGQLYGPCLAMRVRRSRVANVELAFLPGRSLGAKIAALQFPA